MNLAPSVAAFVEATRPYMTMPEGAFTEAEASQRFLRQLRGFPPSARACEPVASVVEQTIADDGPRVRIYRPEDPADDSVLVYFHGGGWVAGDLEMHDSTCRRLVHLLRCTVANVDYRLAPEHPYPVPLEDAYRAVSWVAQNADRLGADPQRLIVAGSSAGGNLAAAVAMKARDLAGPHIAMQVLLYPALDAEAKGDSVREFSTGFGLESDVMRWYWQQYLGDASRRDPLASPLAAADLHALPDALIAVAEFDPLRDDGLRYAQRLEEAGGCAVALTFAGQVHGFLGLLGASEDADAAIKRIAAEIRARMPAHTGRAGLHPM